MLLFTHVAFWRFTYSALVSLVCKMELGVAFLHRVLMIEIMHG